MQIPGVYSTESFYQVDTATTLKTGISSTLYFYGENWICELVDVEAEFLEETLKTKVYINLPKGMLELDFMSQEYYDNASVELTGSMYG